MPVQYDLLIILKLFLAAALGGLIGLEREIHDKPAGFRTHILVSVGSALYMIVSQHFAGPGMDPARVAAQVVTGIGFLGAGTIFRAGSVTKGLTTAASLWTVAGIGLAVGIGGDFFRFALYATLVVLFALVLLARLESRVLTRDRKRLFNIRMADRPGQLGLVATKLGEVGISIRNVETMGTEEDGEMSLGLTLRLPSDLSYEDVAAIIRGISGVCSVTWE